MDFFFKRKKEMGKVCNLILVFEMSDYGVKRNYS